MRNLNEILLSLAAIFVIISGDIFHSECVVNWVVHRDCKEAQRAIVRQINLWDNENCETKPDDQTPHGELCLYKVCNARFINYMYSSSLSTLISHLIY